jgi:hypothetical protein
MGGAGSYYRQEPRSANNVTETELSVIEARDRVEFGNTHAQPLGTDHSSQTRGEARRAQLLARAEAR